MSTARLTRSLLADANRWCLDNLPPAPPPTPSGRHRAPHHPGLLERLLTGSDTTPETSRSEASNPSRKASR